jgi:hypothetical protein
MIPKCGGNQRTQRPCGEKRAGRMGVFPLISPMSPLPVESSPMANFGIILLAGETSCPEGPVSCHQTAPCCQCQREHLGILAMSPCLPSHQQHREYFRSARDPPKIWMECPMELDVEFPLVSYFGRQLHEVCERRALCYSANIMDEKRQRSINPPFQIRRILMLGETQGTWRAAFPFCVEKKQRER